jgi:hypothetical protein
MAAATSINRPLDPAEAFFFLLDRLSSMNFVVFAERAGTLDPQRVRAALQAVQTEDPLLRARIVWTAAGLRFEAADDAPIALELADTSAEGWLALIERELARPFAASEAPLARCLLLRWPGHCVLALTFHHCIADGRSGTELLRRLLGRIANGNSDAVVPARPLPPLHAVFPARFRWEEQPEATEQVYEAVMRDYRRHGKPTPLPWLDASAPSRVPRLLRIEVPADDLQRLLAASRRNGTTVNGALCAAQLLATRQQLPAGDPAVLFLSCPVDLRPHVEPAQPAAPTALYVTMFGASFAVDAATGFWALAREFTTLARTQLARGDGHLFFSLYGLDRAVTEPGGEARVHKMVLATPQGSTVSNVGRVPAVESDPAVQAISFALCPMPYQSLFSAASTYAGRLFVNLAYDAGKQAESTAWACADAMRELLRAAVRAA